MFDGSSVGGQGTYERSSKVTREQPRADGGTDQSETEKNLKLTGAIGRDGFTGSASYTVSESQGAPDAMTKESTTAAAKVKIGKNGITGGNVSLTNSVTDASGAKTSATANFGGSIESGVVTSETATGSDGKPQTQLVLKDAYSAEVGLGLGSANKGATQTIGIGVGFGNAESATLRRR